MNRNFFQRHHPVSSFGARAGALLGAYLSLTKPRIISLLLLTTFTSMIIAQGVMPPLPLLVFTLLGGALMAAAANAVNCYMDADIDCVMSRTRNRPIVMGLIEPSHALYFGGVLATGAFLILTFYVNYLSALLALGGLLIYLLLYTRWKRTTPLSVLVGGIAGAIPPLVGWAAVTNSINLYALAIFSIMVIWQIPHTLALTILLYNDYARADVPVSPVVHGVQATWRQIIASSLLLFAAALVPFALGFNSILYAAGAVLLGARFVQLAYLGSDITRGRNERRLYKFSLLYLALLFALMTADRVLERMWS